MTSHTRLLDLAAAHRVATSYRDWTGAERPVTEDAVRAVLTALGVAAETEEQVASALLEVERRPWARVAPAVEVVVADAPAATSCVTSAVPTLRLVLEDGQAHDLEPGRELDRRGDQVRREVPLPPLPLGYHRLEVVDGPTTASTTVIAVPARLPRIEGRVWGWQAQLYALRSVGSWGVGDYADLRVLAEAAAGDGAGVLLVNPLHAETPVLPLLDSPYSPSSRLFRSALHLRLEDCPEWDDALAALRPETDPERVDRQACWAAKLAALEQMWPRHRAGVLAEFRAERGEPLERFAQFCALAEVHGRDHRLWPEPVGVPDTARVAFWCWVQLLVDEQLRGIGEGMAVGVLHDLAVGVDGGGADAWAMQDVLASGATIGAPPDELAQRGQDWGLPPWHPDRLRDQAYVPYRDLVRGVLRHAGGIRIDHVLGLSRLWWVPEGRPSSDGSYVGYDAEALLGILALEATRAGAIVVGEDLGTVEATMRARLDRVGVLGSDVLWFARADDGSFVPPAQWRAEAAASVTTHDLPTVAGWASGASVRLRAEVGQLARPVEEEEQAQARERASLLTMLADEGLLDEDVCLSLHRALVASPCRVVLAAYGDAVGDLRQPNLPGTVDQYPNWRLPVADGAGTALTLEQVLEHPGVARLTALLQHVR